MSTPAKEEVLSELYGVANDAESDALDEILLRLGWRWRCEDCGWMNAADDADTCGGCGTAKPATE